MIYAWLIGAWLCHCVYIADREHRQAGVSRWAYALVAALASLGWPIIVGMAIRKVMLRRREKGVEA